MGERHATDVQIGSSYCVVKETGERVYRWRTENQPLMLPGRLDKG
jgi:hypothetical protein